MHYLSLTELEPFCSHIAFPLLNEQQEAELRLVIDAYEPWNQYGVIEKEGLITHAKNEKDCLFYRWVSEDKALEMCLLTKQIITNRSDLSYQQQSSWFKDFQQFLTPFLSPIIQRNAVDLSWDKCVTLLGYNRLLLHNEQGALVTKIAQFSAECQLELSKALKSTRSDQAAFELLSTALPPLFWQTLNNIDSEYYVVKTNWIEYLIGLLHAPNSSRRLMLFVFESLKELKVSPEHANQLKALERDLKQGKISIEQRQFSLKKVLLFAVLVLGILGFSLGLWYFPNATTEGLYQDQTSFMKLSPSERAHLDTLIQQVNQTKKATHLAETDVSMQPTAIQLIPEKNWQNLRFKSIYNAWKNNNTIGASSTFNGTGKEFRSFPGTLHLLRKKGVNASEIHNATNLRILLMVFKDSPTEKVYSAYVEAKGDFHFQLNPGDKLLVLPGGKVPIHLKKNQLPFNEIDARFFDNLTTSFRVRNFPNRAIRLAWETISTHEMYLVDLTGSLEME
jgi:hypothetical protein